MFVAGRSRQLAIILVFTPDECGSYIEYTEY